MNILQIRNWMEKNITFLFLAAAGIMAVLCMLIEFSTFLDSVCNYDFCVTLVIFFIFGAFWSRIPRLEANRTWLPTVLGILSFPFFCFALGSAGFLFGISVSKWEGVAAFLLSMLLMAWKAETRKAFAVSFGVFLGVWFFALFFSVIGWEHREDGMLYHKPGSILIAKGWNPVWEENLEQYMLNHGENPDELRYSHAAYFPKGLWVVNAILHLMTGSTNAGAAIYPAMIAGCCILFSFMLQSWFPIGRWTALIVGTILAQNPNILVEEIYSGMIDGPLQLCLLTFLFAGILLLKNGDRKWFPFLIGSAVFGCSMKHNAPVFFACIGFIYTLAYAWFYFKKRLYILRVPFREWMLAMISVPVLTAVFCFNPFITNSVCHSSPFYPLHTLNPQKHPAEDILGIYYWRQDFREAGKLQRFIFTHILQRRHFVDPLMADAPEYSPESVHFLQIIPGFSNNGIFPLLIVFTFPLLFFVRRWDFWLILLAIVISTAIHPHSWWGRFVPQFWAFPYLLLCFTNVEVRAVFSASESAAENEKNNKNTTQKNVQNIKIPSSSGINTECCTKICHTKIRAANRTGNRSWLARWNVLFMLFLCWSLWTNASIFSYFHFYQLYYVFLQDALLAKTEDVPDFLLLGGIQEKNEKKGTTILKMHPWYQYYDRELFRSLGISKFYVSALVTDKPDTIEVRKAARVYLITPIPSKKEKISGEEIAAKPLPPVRASYFPQVFRRTACICGNQLRNAWCEDSIFSFRCKADGDEKPEWILNFEKLESEENRKAKEDLRLRNEKRRNAMKIAPHTDAEGGEK